MGKGPKLSPLTPSGSGQAGNEDEGRVVSCQADGSKCVLTESACSDWSICCFQAFQTLEKPLNKLNNDNQQEQHNLQRRKSLIYGAAIP